MKNIGENDINVDEVCESWNDLWYLTQYNDEFTLTKFKRKKSDEKELKTKISQKDAKAIIKKLNMVNVPSGTFTNSSRWIKK